MQQNRLQSPVVWAALAAQVLTMLVMLGVVDTGFSDTVNGLVAAVLDLLVLFGVLNNPTAGKQF